MPVYTLRIISMMLTMLYTMISLSTCSATVPVQAPDVSQEAAPLGQSGSGTVAINIFQSREDASIALQKAVDIYTSQNPNVQIRIHTVDGVPEYQSALRSRLLNGNQVDIFHLFGYQDLSQLKEYVAPVPDSLSWATDTYNLLLDPVSIEDAIYAIPYSLEGVGLIVNRAVFDAAGIPLEELQDFEGMADAFAKLREQIDSGTLAEAFPALEYVTEFPALDRSFVADQLVDIALGSVFTTPEQAAEARLVNLEGSTALEEYVKLMARYSSSRGDWEGLNGVSRTQQVEYGLASERVAIIQQSTAVWRQIYKLDPDVSSNLALLPIPLMEQDQGSLYVGTPCYWAVNAQSDPMSAQLAWDFLTWLYQSQEGQQLLFEEFSILSPYTDPVENTGVSLYSQLLRYIGRRQYLPWLHSEAPSGWTGSIFAPALRSYFASDDLNWLEFVQEIQSGWNRPQHR